MANHQKRMELGRGDMGEYQTYASALDHRHDRDLPIHMAVRTGPLILHSPSRAACHSVFAACLPHSIGPAAGIYILLVFYETIWPLPEKRLDSHHV